MQNKRQNTELRVVGLRRYGTTAAAEETTAAAATGRYRAQIERYAQRIRKTQDPAEIATILGEALSDTHALAASEQAQERRDRIAEAERQIATLKAELETVTMLLRTDPLTGALNRRGLEEIFFREAARADRHASPLSIVLIDLDDFKRLNDSHGHQAGDAALVHLVDTARKTLRPNDCIARYGGEEFTLIFPDTTLDDARQCALRLQNALAAKPLRLCRQSLRVTFSAGVAQRLPAETLQDGLQRADRGLYEAKHAGKNCIRPTA